MNIKISINDSVDHVIKKLVFNKIFYSNLTFNEGLVYLDINYKDLKFLKYFYGKKIKIIKYYGIEGFVNFIKYHLVLILSFIWGIIMLFLLSNIIFKIEVNTEDETLKQNITYELESHDIKKYSFKKSFKELQAIKDEIKNHNLKTIEWIEIREVGTKYIIELTPRVIKEKNEDDESISSIVASKDGRILHLTASSGEVLKNVGDYVKKEEEIISGNIYKNEETLKAQVKAEGKVYAEVWYTINTTIPYEYVEYKRTGETINHYYIEIFGKKMTLIGKYNTNYSMNETKLLIDKPYLPFKIYKERKEIYEYKNIKVSVNEAKDEAIKRSEESLKNKLDDDEYIIDKKVLNINEFSSKINVEVFYKVYENIGKIKILEKDKKK